MTERIRVSGFRPPLVFFGRRGRVQPVAAIRPINLLGPLGAIAMLVAVLLCGTPHMLLTYAARGSGADRYYDDCAYAALDGRMAHLRGASCPLFRLLPEGR